MWGGFREPLKKGPEDRNIDTNILEEQVGDFHEMGNSELEEQKVNNDIVGSQLENLQYKLPHGNGKYSREQSQEIIEQEIPGARKEIHKETYNSYGGAGGELK